MSRLFQLALVGLIVVGCTAHCTVLFCSRGVAESGDDFTQFSTISQWFQTLIHPLIQQRRSRKPACQFNFCNLA
ncbi:Mobile element protein [Richelia intracellularis]|nr:Mobile element protein [Richelia intracellularis]